MSERKNGRLPILTVLFTSQLVLLSLQQRYYGSGPNSQDIERDVMAQHYRVCLIQWVKSTYYYTQEESVTCIADETTSAVVYQRPDQNWVAYGWGLKGGSHFRTKEEAKRFLEKQIVPWNQKPPLLMLSKIRLWN